MSNQEEFTITKNHLLLLHHSCWDWQDSCFGAPAIDSKRPYGSSSVHSSMGEILGIKEGTKKHTSFTNGPLAGEYPEFTDEQKATMDELHSGLMQVLEIGITLGYFAPGVYVREDPREERSWRPKEKYMVPMSQIECIDSCIAQLDVITKNPRLAKVNVQEALNSKIKLIQLKASLLGAKS